MIYFKHTLKSNKKLLYMKQLILKTLVIVLYVHVSAFSQNQDSNSWSYTIGCEEGGGNATLYDWAFNEYVRLGNVPPPIVRTDDEIYEMLKDREYFSEFFTQTNQLKEEWYVLRYVPEEKIDRCYFCLATLKKANNEVGNWKNEIHDLNTIADFENFLVKYPIIGRYEITNMEREFGMSFSDLLKKMKSHEYLIYTHKDYFAIFVYENTEFHNVTNSQDPNLKRLN